MKLEEQAEKREFRYIGKEIPKVDGADLVTGRAKYANDFIVPGAVPAACLYADAAHAQIHSVSAEKARQVPGVLAVITAADLTGETVWEKQQILAGEAVRFHGEALAIAAAEDEAALQAALEAIEVSLTPLPTLDSATEAATGGKRFYEDRTDNLIEGSHWEVHKAEGESRPGAVSLERSYQTQYVEHMYIEPEAVLVIPEGERCTVVASMQGIYLVQSAVATALGVPLNHVRMVQPYVGGSFGGKNEGIGMLAARAALMARRLNRPVRMRMSRMESVRATSKRHPMTCRYRVEAGEDGAIRSMQAKILAEGGAYATMTPFVNWRGCVHACGCYRVPRVEVDISGYYTNRGMGGAFRGFSSPQIIFAQESLMDELAESLGLSPLELRRRNILRQGERSATSQRMDTQILPLDALLDLAEARTGFSEKYRAPHRTPDGWRKGIGLALSYRGCGFGAESADATGAYLAMHKDGSVTLRSALVDVGQGLHTVFCQILADTLGVRLSDVRMERADTSVLPDGNLTSASRGTFRGGRAVQGAAEILRARLLAFAAQLTERPVETMRLSEGVLSSRCDAGFTMPLARLAAEAFNSGVDLACWYWLPSEGVSWDHESGSGDAYLTYACSVVVTELSVRELTGEIRLDHVFACHDVGRAINPALAKSQISGGIAMGLGMAFQEEVKYREGKVCNGSFHDYMIPGALDLPACEIVLYENEDPHGPYHAKSLGEACSEAVAASAANAVANAVGLRFRRLPITQEALLLRMRTEAEKRGTAYGGS